MDVFAFTEESIGFVQLSGQVFTMVGIFASVFSLIPYHILSYGTLLGTELYQTFVMTGITFRALPMAQFTTLQKRVFPAYFRLQVGLTVLTIATFPAHGPLDLIKSGWSSWAPLAVNLGTALLNQHVYGPRTIAWLMRRIHQHTKDGRKYIDKDNISDELQQIKRQFSRNHAMSIHLNLIGVLATLLHGLVLSSKIEVVH